MRVTTEQYEAMLAKRKAHLNDSNGNSATSPSITRTKAKAIQRAITDEDALNKTERAWLQVLRAKKYPIIGIQDHTLKLADRCRYSPDFRTVDNQGETIMWEVKGFLRDDALVKIKTAARTFPEYRFIMVMKDKTGWTEREFKP